MVLWIPQNVTLVKVKTRPSLINAKGEPTGACRKGQKRNDPAVLPSCGKVTTLQNLLFWSMGPMIPKKKYTLTVLVRPKDPFTPVAVEIPTFFFEMGPSKKKGGWDYPTVRCGLSAFTKVR